MAMPGVAKISGWEESLSPICHPSAFVHSIWGWEHPRQAEGQSAVTTKHSKFQREGRLNCQITLGCVYGSREETSP